MWCIMPRVASARSYATRSSPAAAQVLEIVQGAGPLADKNKAVFRKYWGHMGKHEIPSEGNTPDKSVAATVAPERLQEWVQRNKDVSSTSRGFYRRELIYNIGNPLVVGRILKAVKPLQDTTVPLGDAEIFYWCINDSIETGDHVMALDLYVLYYRMRPQMPLSVPLASKLLATVTFNDPRLNHISLQKYLRLSELFSARKTVLPLTSFQYYSIMVIANNEKNNKDLRKQVLNELLSAQIQTSLDWATQQKLRVAYDLIKRDCRINNPAGVKMTWDKIKDWCDPLTQMDPRIIYSVFHKFNASVVYRNLCQDILARLPPMYVCNNPLLLPEVLKYIAQTSSLEQARALIQNMRRYTTADVQELLWNSRPYLSALFEMQLHFHDYENSNQTRKRMEEQTGSLSSKEYKIIVDQLLVETGFADQGNGEDMQAVPLSKEERAKNVLQVIKLLDTLPGYKSSPIYPTVLSKLMKWDTSANLSLNINVFPLVNEILTKMDKSDPSHKSNFWEYLSPIYIRSLIDTEQYEARRSCTLQDADTQTESVHCSGESLDLAKYLYLKSQPSHNEFGHFNPWAVQNPMEINLKVTRKNSLPILRTIAYGARRFQRYDIFLWCCSTLKKEGVSTEELEADWTMRFNTDKVKESNSTEHDQSSLDNPPQM